MIIAKQMQETMHSEVGDMMEERLVLRPRFSLYGFEGQDNIAKVARTAS